MTAWLDTYIEWEVPPGLTANFDKPNARGIVFIVLCLFLLICSTTFGGIRVYTKAFITRAMGWDDCEILVHHCAQSEELTVSSQIHAFAPW